MQYPLNSLLQISIAVLSFFMPKLLSAFDFSWKG
jgi:hypothetical protein